MASRLISGCLQQRSRYSCRMLRQPSDVMYTAWSFLYNLLFFRTVSTPLLSRAGDEANGHVRPSSSLRFVQYSLDCGGWLALILGHCRCVG